MYEIDKNWKMLSCSDWKKCSYIKSYSLGFPHYIAFNMKPASWVATLTLDSSVSSPWMFSSLPTKYYIFLWQPSWEEIVGSIQVVCQGSAPFRSNSQAFSACWLTRVVLNGQTLNKSCVYLPCHLNMAAREKSDSWSPDVQLPTRLQIIPPITSSASSHCSFPLCRLSSAPLWFLFGCVIFFLTCLPVTWSTFDTEEKITINCRFTPEKVGCSSTRVYGVYLFSLLLTVGLFKRTFLEFTLQCPFCPFHFLRDILISN